MPSATTAANGKSILITGCSTGIGKRAAEMLHDDGWQVFATARQDEDITMLNDQLGVTGLYLDYQDKASIKAVADQVLDQTGGSLFALFNNGGYGQPGAVEDLETDVLRAQFETNFFGWHDLTRQFIPAMRENGGGRIIQCSSVFGFVSAHYRGAYTASKHALEALSDAMRQELRGTNIHVSIIEPGPIRTAFNERALKSYRDNINMNASPHRDKYQQRVDDLENGGDSTFKLEPDAVVEKLRHALTAKNPKTRYYVTVPTYVLAYAKRLLPTKLIDEILIRN